MSQPQPDPFEGWETMTIEDRTNLALTVITNSELAFADPVFWSGFQHVMNTSTNPDERREAEKVLFDKVFELRRQGMMTLREEVQQKAQQIAEIVHFRSGVWIHVMAHMYEFQRRREGREGSGSLRPSFERTHPS